MGAPVLGVITVGRMRVGALCVYRPGYERCFGCRSRVVGVAAGG